MLKESRKIRSNNSLFKYYIYYPNTIKKNMPVLVYLHGIGERGNKLDDIDKYALPKYMNRFEIPYIVIAPQCHDNNFWDYHLRDVEKVIDREYKNFKFDKKNIFILGSSIMLPIEQNLQLIKNKPILIYHGDKDDVVDVSESTSIYNKLVSMGANNVELKVIKNDNHFLTSHAFKDNYIYEWLDKNIEGV